MRILCSLALVALVTTATAQQKLPWLKRGFQASVIASDYRVEIGYQFGNYALAQSPVCISPGFGGFGQFFMRDNLALRLSAEGRWFNNTLHISSRNIASGPDVMLTEKSLRTAATQVATDLLIYISEPREGLYMGFSLALSQTYSPRFNRDYLANSLSGGFSFGYDKPNTRNLFSPELRFQQGFYGLTRSTTVIPSTGWHNLTRTEVTLALRYEFNAG